VAPRPLFDRGLAFIVTGFNKAELWAVKTDGESDVTDTGVVWKLKTRVGKYASPILVDGLIYTAAEESFVTCLEAATGEVVWTERIGGKYVRLERPFPVYGRGGVDRFDIWLADSPDLRYWGNIQLVLGVEDVPYANDKIGPAAPPVRTEKGWLTLFHAVDRDNNRGKNGWEEKWQKRYTAGVMLLDRDDPRKIVGLSREPLMVPEAPYEVSGGIRNHVIFPGGMILEKSGEVKLYYGSADTVECLATADVGELLALCAPFSR
jgi:predicted GH43/DUF377 family glycosyl hydrolase